MITSTVSPRSALDDPLTVVDQQIAEAEQRRDRQVRAMSDLAEGTQLRAYAEHVLGLMELNLAISRAHQALIRDLRDTA